MTESGTVARQKVFWLALGLVLCALCLLLIFQLDPAKHGFFPRCLFHQYTGLQCPGCGGQRAVHHLLHGDMAGAFRCNALFVTLLPVGAWHVARRALKQWRGWELPALFAHWAWLWVLGGMTIAFAVMRNLPAFDWLRP